MIGHPLKVRELLDEVARGEVLLPEIQRAYVWKGPQVAKLIDSLYHEYPSGQLLLWDTGQLPMTKQLSGVAQFSGQTNARPKVVLDGQQRLTSLVLALAPPGVLNEERQPLRIYFHLETEDFERYSSKMKGDSRWVSVRDIITEQRHDIDILQAIESAGLAEMKSPQGRRYLDRLQKVKRIGEYKYPIEIFKSDDYEEVTELFVRINSGGTRLRAAELVLAQLALRLPGALVQTFEKALDEYEDSGYALDTRFLIRALIAVGTGQSRFRYLTEFWQKKPEEIAQIWDRTKKGIDTAVNFVRHNARFESSDWLPSLQPLITLTALFTTHDRVAPKVETELLRWFYIVSLKARYTTSAETALDEDLKAVVGDDPVQQLLTNATGPTGWKPVHPDELDDAGERNPLFAMTYAAARRAGAKDWFKGVSLTTDVIGDDHEVQIHHVFPKALLRERGVRRKDIDEIANLAFLAARPNRQISKSPPDVYLAQIADAHPQRLVAQCIPMDRALWKLERYQDFLAERRKLLAKSINDLIENPN